MTPTAKTLVLDLLSTLRGEEQDVSMPVAALVEAGALFGLQGNNVRVTLNRLLAAGLVVRDARGRYRLGVAARAVSSQAGAWRRSTDRLRPWGGDWLAVHRAEPPRPRSREHRAAERALRLWGLRELQSGLWLRPDNLRGGLLAARQGLGQLGLEPTALVATLQGLDVEPEGRARALWDVCELNRSYAETHARLTRSECELQSMGIEQAMVTSFREGGSALRQLALDPWLPAELVDDRARQALIRTLAHYDRVGRGYWSQFMAQHGVRHLRSGFDLHTASGVPA